MSAIAIVESRADRASTHICDRLRDLESWTELTDESRPDDDGGGTYYRTDGFELRSFADRHLDLERPVEAFDCDPDVLVFASRHAGDTGPLLTGHFTGNVGPAEYGGDDFAVAEACPNALVRLLEAFDDHAPDGYGVGMECTHHGPTDVGCPSLFAELGSDDEQWDDPEGAEAVARAILELRGVSPHAEPIGVGPTGRGNGDTISRRQVVGFGGNHYAPRFERIVRETPWAVGHVVPDWALKELGHPSAHVDVLEAVFAASETELAVIDDDRPVLAETIEGMGYRLVSETWLREVGDRPLTLVEAVETHLGAIEDGTRFGERTASSIAVIDLPTDLVDVAEGIDAEQVREIVASRVVAFATENGGSRVGSRVAVPEDDTDSRVAIGEALADVLASTFDSVTVEDGAVVTAETAFDPKLAREAGVSEGPAFGKLANGEAVTVDGERITPESVHVDRTRRFQL
ncbi:D-aminoacyl-tRNA deacylase [Natrarchaeobius sp. A-rgal3]|uniref:D-aminoacyl-tRNA deacylase n=1 Tax=Natrarchaeobius versutus TaxID=1679078 RepID=UPI00350F4C01